MKIRIDDLQAAIASLPKPSDGAGAPRHIDIPIMLAFQYNDPSARRDPPTNTPPAKLRFHRGAGVNLNTWVIDIDVDVD
jgi:hypothetical protein